MATKSRLNRTKAVNRMSMYGESEKGKAKEELFYLMRDFVERYPVSELMEIIAYVFEAVESEVE